MKTLIHKLKWTGVAAILTAFVGAPALADDTELLVINPAAVTATPPKPNILFILDSSGSMKDPVNTRKIYDNNRDYSSEGNCDKDRLYWTEVDAVPSCDSSNTRYFEKSAFVCADSKRRIDGIGRYTGLMTQYRTGSSGVLSLILGITSARWQHILPGDSTSMVECEKDGGVHGDGVNSTNLYAATGADQDPFTNNSSAEVDWGSFPTSQIVTVYDGNYLNYRATPEFEDQRKVDIMIDVTERVLESVSNVNVGIMRFNYDDGGPVIQAIQDLDTNRSDIVASVKSISADGYTPLAETLYESALYWRGLAADYGENISDYDTDPAALSSDPDDPEIYQAPATNVCAKNFNVLLTDGKPVRDTEAQTKAPGLPNWFDTLGRNNCTGTEEGDCLDDISEYLFKDDISTNAGFQSVTTHTIGFDIDLPILKTTAEASDGEYFQADDVESLTLALLNIVSRIQERSLSFTAPAVAVNSFNRTRNLNDLYLTTFAAKQKIHWPGNLKKYRIKVDEIVDKNGAAAVDVTTGFFRSDAQSFWSTEEDGNDVKLGGAAANIPAYSTRNVYTDISTDKDLFAAGNALSVSNESSFALSDFALTGSSDEPTKEELIRWARGEDIRDEDNDNTTAESRKVMGDPLHSQPAAVVYGGSATSPDVVIYTATNDGYVHALNGATGEELWSFIPKELLPNLSKLYFDPAALYKNYGVDGDIVPVVYDDDGDGVIESGDGDFVNIIFGFRRGGSAYYALDVTNKNQPKLKWRVAASSFGQSWSTPSVARIKVDNGTTVEEKVVAIVGGGYDTAHDTLTHRSSADATGNGIYFIDLADGSVIWRAGPDNPANLTLSSMTRSIATQVRVIDVNGDGFADRMYASDMGGQILRFDINNGQDTTGLVTGGVIAQLGAEGMATPTDADTRRFYSAPDVSIFNDTVQNRRFIAISIGSGYRAHPLDNTPTERFYSLRDPDIFNALSQDDYNNYTVIKEDTLVDVQGTVRATIGSNKNGWMFTLPADQKVLTSSVTFNNEVFFVAFSPDSAAVATCAAGLGRNFLYRVSVTNGDPVVNNLDTLAASEADGERVSDLAQGGIAPSPQFLFPSPEASCTGDACNPPPLGCVGVECFDPGFANNPVRTLWTQDGIE